MPKTLSFILSAFLMIAGFNCEATAQDLPDVAQGLQPYGAYHGGQLDSVDTIYGGLTVKIPLLSYPQKGSSLALSYSVYVNSFGIQDLATCTEESGASGPVATIPYKNGCKNAYQLMPLSSGAPPVGAHIVADQLLRAGGLSQVSDHPTGYQDPIYGRLYVVSADNAQHPLAPYGGRFYSVDESGYMFTFAPDASLGGSIPLPPQNPLDTQPLVPARGTIFDSHGNMYNGSTISDPDGNAISFGAGSGIIAGVPAVDSAQRNIPDTAPIDLSSANCPTLPNAQSQPLSSAYTWTVPGPNGSVVYKLCYATVTVHTHLAVGPNDTDYVHTYPVLQSIVLPNGQHWGFVYSSEGATLPGGALPISRGLGELIDIIFPTGGSLEYTYILGDGKCNVNRPNGTNGRKNLAMPAVVTSRSMLDSQGHVLGTWQYGDGTVIAPDGNLTVTNEVSDGNPDSACGYRDGGQTVYAGSEPTGTPIKSVVKNYDTTLVPGLPFASGARVSSVVTTLASGLSTTETLSYAQLSLGEIDCDYQDQNCAVAGASAVPFGEPTIITTTGYDGGALKSVATHYAWQSNGSYLGANFVDLPDRVATSQNPAADGTPCSENLSIVTYAYDEPAYSPGGVRGHLTSTTNCLNTSSSQPTVHTGWDGAGRKIYAIDAEGSAGNSLHLNPTTHHTTDYYYTPSGASVDSAANCWGSALMSTTNALGHTVSAAYDCSANLITSFVDANQQTTSIAWDSMRRPLSFVYPSVAYSASGDILQANPVTSFVYDDANDTVTQQMLATPDPPRATSVVFDSFGRELHRYTSDSGGGQVTVDTTYDSTGRVQSVTNPYRTTQDATYGVTAYTYDPLGRKIVTTQPDGTMLSTCYDGVQTSSDQLNCSPDASSYSQQSWTDTTDESGRHWQHVSDALDRLLAVMEPQPDTGALGLQTLYSYDGLGNLSHVWQVGASGETPRSRSFTYDSLSRLISSNNPETGTICYGSTSSGGCSGGYDLNGNLLLKTDANGIVLSYSYDGLNRLTAKYSADFQVNDHFYWDLPFGYGVGHLTWTDHSGTAGNGYYYDAMGRVDGISYSAPGIGGWAGALSIQYDLGGSPNWLVYPDGRSVAQTYDAAGHLTSVMDTTQTGGGTAYFSNAIYTPAGALLSATYGNGVIAEALAYNARQQPCHTTAATAALGNTQGTPVFDRVTSFAADPNSSSPCGPEAGDNGNLTYIADNLNAGLTQSFSYDGLNRLRTAARSDGAYNHTYNYDSFGNMILQDHLHSTPVMAIDPATNRLLQNPGVVGANGQPSGDFTYDAAGNLISTGSGGHTFTYNALNQVYLVDNGNTAGYFYNGNDERAAKYTPSGWTDYVYWNGQVMAEEVSNSSYQSVGNWTDYIYANGQKIAKVQSQPMFLRLSGTIADGNTANFYNMPWSPDPANAQIKAGDRLVFRQRDSAGVCGGISIIFSDWSQNANNPAYGDQYGPVNQGCPPTTDWVTRSFDLTPFAGRQTQFLAPGQEMGSTPGDFTVDFADVALVRADGTVVPIYTGGASNPFGAYLAYAPGDTTNRSFVAVSGGAADSAVATRYFLDDHLGTTQVELATGGWPLWQGQFTPFGTEIVNGAQLQPGADDGSGMPFKFTGKERDTESGLDYFGARYYASSMGRWMSPDWRAKEEPVPYAKLDDPQSLNLYGYVNNNPLSRADPDGHCPTCEQVFEEDVAPVLEEGAGAIEKYGATALHAIGTFFAAAAASAGAGDQSGSRLSCLACAAAPPTTAEMAAQTKNSGAADAKPQEPTSSAGGETAGERFKPGDRAADAGKKCVYCGRQTTEEPGKDNSRETDHGQPRSRGGNRESENRNPSCRTCNRQKGNKTPEEFKRWQQQNPDKVPKAFLILPRWKDEEHWQPIAA